VSRREGATDDVGRICLCAEAGISFEHVPPRAAFNDGRVRVSGLEDWLGRATDGSMNWQAVQQRGVGFRSLCPRCNNRADTWYVGELLRAVGTGVALLRQIPPDNVADADPDPHVVQIGLGGVRGLALIKQIVVMILAINGAEFARRQHQLRAFVADRDRTGLSPRYRVYLVLYRGPLIRTIGLASSLNLGTGHNTLLSEVAYPPLAYLLTVDTPAGVLPVGDITGLADVPYGTEVSFDLDLVVGFGHTPYPGDYRSQAAIDIDAARNG
jgi:hypothetical protein